MSEIEASLFGCIAILPRLTNLSVVIDELFNQRNQSIEQYLHHKVSVVDKHFNVLTIAHIPDMPSTA
jgi:phosphatidylserine/phosphatidylglycerophosphate/cardiolipin synthase-like enzyme